jgi:hypothetical protein
LFDLITSLVGIVSMLIELVAFIVAVVRGLVRAAASPRASLRKAVHLFRTAPRRWWDS